MLYEAPHRLLDTLEDALEILGNRQVVVAREVTKLYEEFMRGRIETLLEDLRKKAPRGEITLLIAPPDEEASHAEAGAGIRLRRCRWRGAWRKLRWSAGWIRSRR